MLTSPHGKFTEIPELVRFLSPGKGITIHLLSHGTEDRLFFQIHSGGVERFTGLKKAGYPSSPIPGAARHADPMVALSVLVDCQSGRAHISGCRGRAEIDCSKCGLTPIRKYPWRFAVIHAPF
jgi:hypothetical protein